MVSPVRNRGLDWALRVVGLLLVGVIAFLGYTVWTTERGEQQASISTRAIANLEKAVSENPKSPDARILLGDAYRDTGRLAEAVEQYDAALKLDKDHPGALTGLGMVALQQEEWQTAEKYWLRAIEVLKKNKFAAQDQRLEKAYYYYGVTLLQTKAYEEAIGAFKEALRIRRDDSDTHYALSIAYRELDLPENQRNSLEAALTFVPTMPEANYDLGLLLLADGDEAGAAELFRRSVDNAPGREEPLAALEKLGPFEKRLAAAESLKSGDPEAALLEARVAAALEPDNVKAARTVAQLLQEVSEPKEAELAWKHVLELVPDDSEATEALDALGTSE